MCHVIFFINITRTSIFKKNKHFKIPVFPFDLILISQAPLTPRYLYYSHTSPAEADREPPVYVRRPVRILGETREEPLRQTWFVFQRISCPLFCFE